MLCFYVKYRVLRFFSYLCTQNIIVMVDKRTLEFILPAQQEAAQVHGPRRKEHADEAEERDIAQQAGHAANHHVLSDAEQVLGHDGDEGDGGLYHLEHPFRAEAADDADGDIVEAVEDLGHGHDDAGDSRVGYDLKRRCTEVSVIVRIMQLFVKFGKIS